MEDSKFYEIREQLYSLIRTFIDECEKQGIEYREEVDTIIDEIESSN